MIEWSIETVKIADLMEYAKNARILSKEQESHLKESLDKFGQCQPIIINTDKCIIGGHQRYRILKKTGVKNADVFVPSRTLEAKEVEELNIRLNKNTGDWDWDMLANTWDVFDLIEWGFTLEDLDIKSNDKEEVQEKQKLKLEIKFENETDLIAAQNKIEPILLEITGAQWKTKK